MLNLVIKLLPACEHKKLSAVAEINNKETRCAEKEIERASE